MPFPRSFLRHTLIWSLPGGETANTTCAWAEASTIISLDAISVNMLAAKGLAMWNDIKPAYAPQILYLGSRVQWVAMDGHVVETAERIITGVPGTGGGNQLPQEVAVVTSLRTALASRRGRGRMYLPAPAYGALTSLSRLDTTIRDDIAQAMSTYLDSDALTGLFSVVASATGTLLSQVTECRVGDVFDSQRRRRDSLIESYKIELVS